MRHHEESNRRSSGRGAASPEPPLLLKAMLGLLVVLAFVALVSVMSRANPNFAAGTPAAIQSVQPDAAALQ
jgi:hypothetical protein